MERTAPSQNKFLSKSSTRSANVNSRKSSKNGTVKSIPIKNYRTSIVQSIGTLRKSIPVQYQFESDKQLDIFGWQKPKSDLKSTLNLGTFDGTPLILEQRPSKRRNLSAENYRMSTGTIDPEASPDSLECCNLVDQLNVDAHRSSSRLYSKKQNPNSKFHDVPTLESGNVFQKINAYEEKSCRTKQERRIDSRLGMTEIRRCKPMGVPLVGMHNACGLPVIAHWQNSRRLKSSLRGSVLRSSRRSRNHQTHPKRKAFYDLNESGLKSEWVLHTERSRSSSIRKMAKRSSLKASSKIGTFSAKKVLKGKRDDGEKESMICRLGGSFGRRSGKRTTLYAKDGGEEAVNALKKLCLNPLARNSKGDVMIW